MSAKYLATKIAGARYAPSPRDFECPACRALPGTPCRSTRGKSQSTFHTLRHYKASDAWAVSRGPWAGAKASK